MLLDTFVTFVKIFVLLTIIVLFFLVARHESHRDFIHIGPGTNENNTTRIFGVDLDTWNKVILI